MDEMINRFRKSNRACFCAAALVLSNALSVFTTASGLSRLLESFSTGIVLSVMLQAFKLLCEWGVARGVDRRRKYAAVIFAVLCAAYILTTGFSVFFSEVEFVSYGYSTKWEAISQSAVEKGYTRQLQALSDEAASRKTTLQEGIAQTLDAIQSGISDGNSAERVTLLEQAQANEILNKYAPVLSDDGETLFDPQADRWFAQLRSAVQTLSGGETVDELDDMIAELSSEIEQTNDDADALMAKIRTTRTSRSDKNIREANDSYAQQLISQLNRENAKLTQYRQIKTDMETLNDSQKRVQNSAEARLKTAKMACRKALLTSPETLADSTRAFVEAAAELDEAQTENYTKLRAQANEYAVMEELVNYCGREETADHTQNWSEAVAQLRKQASRLPESSKARSSILSALDGLRATYLSGTPDPLSQTLAILVKVPAGYRPTAIICLFIAILLDGLSLMANLNWPKERAAED